MADPFLDLDKLLPASVKEVVGRSTPIPTIAIKASEMQAVHPELVRADIGQISGLDPDAEVLYGPPVGLSELRAAVAELWTRTFHLNRHPGLEKGLTAANVAITTGAAEALSLLFRCFGHERVVALPRGHWENYLNAVSLANGEAVVVDFFDERGELDIAGLATQLEKRKASVLVVNFPCNPTGAVLNEAEMSQLAELARMKNVVLIADEVYSRLRYDGHRPVSLLEFAPERTAVVSSASKEYLLPGARIGYVISAHADLTDRVLRKLIRANTASPNVLGQRMVLELMKKELEALRGGQEPESIARIRGELRTRKENLVRVLETHGFKFVGRAGRAPMGTIFLMASLPEWWKGTDVEFADHALERACVSVVPGSAFGIPDSVRFSFGGMTNRAIRQLDENLGKLH